MWPSYALAGYFAVDPGFFDSIAAAANSSVAVESISLYLVTVVANGTKTHN